MKFRLFFYFRNGKTLIKKVFWFRALLILPISCRTRERNIPIMAKTKSILDNYMTENHLLENGRQQSP
uniref:hypothetical protein n=1 Tax=Aneurinibacillus terranovensis TaxID=278991 RepID=UPI001B7F937D